MRIRPLKFEDLPLLLAMWNATARFDRLTLKLLDEKTRGDGDFDPELALVCEKGGVVTGFVMGVLRQVSGSPRGTVKLAAVATDYQRQGIGSRLLAAVEHALRKRGASTVRVCESAPNYLTPGVDCRYTSAPYFFAKHGYRQWGEACDMTVDLDGRAFPVADREQALAERGFEIRRARTADRDAVMRLLESHWPSWKAEVGHGFQSEPPSLHLASQGEKVQAFAAWDTNNFGTGWFGPMGTAPGARGQGLGRLLLFCCLADIKAAGHRYAIIPWVEPVRFYEVCAGAAVSRIYHRYEKEL